MAFKAGKDDEYVKLIRKAGLEYNQLGQISTQEACEYIEMGEANYVSSFKNCEKRPEIMRQIQENEMSVRDSAEPQGEIKFSKEELKKIHMEKVEMEFDMETKMSKVMVPSKQEAQQLMMMERTKIMDKLYVKYNVKLVDLMRGFKKYELENDTDVKTQQQAIAAKAKELIEAEHKANSLTEE